MHALIASTAAAAPAGGAALDQVAIATGFATFFTVLLFWLCLGHRSGKVPFLSRAGKTAERLSGLPGWAALPTAVATVALLIAVIGMYWDISLHIDNGRDPGPLANPAHYLILFGLYGVFASGILACCMPKPGTRPGRAAIKLRPDWYAPVGGVLMAAAGSFALIGFPLDDIWHRLFGQDVTLWGPTHLMLIGGAGMTLIGQAVLLAEALHVRAELNPREAGSTVERRQGLVVWTRRAALMGGVLIGLSTFQGEFDFGVPQFRFIFQPGLIALAAALALVAARLWVGRGGAIAAAIFFLVVRGSVSLIVGVIFGQTMPSLALYLPEALLVEALAFVAFSSNPNRRPLAFGASAGVLVATVGLAGEWLWTQVAMPLPWTSALLPEAIWVALLTGVAGGLVGALLGTGLRGSLPRPAVARGVMIAASVMIAIVMVDGLTTTGPDGARADIRLTTVHPGPDRTVRVAARITPDKLARDASWVTVTAWQGGGLDVARLHRGADGVWRSHEAIPVHGQWKSTLRVQNGHKVIAVGIYLPEDKAIPVKGVPANAHIDRAFELDSHLLQRERKFDVPGWLWGTAVTTVLVLYVLFLGALAWGVARVARRNRGDNRGGPQPERTAAAPPRPAVPAGA
jgi:hypothetical protein